MKSALLKNNSHIKFTHFKWTSMSFLTRVYSCVITTIIQAWNDSITPKGPPCPFAVRPLPSTAAGEATPNLLSDLQICLSRLRCQLHRNGCLLGLAFSLSTLLLALKLSAVEPFLLQSNTPLQGCTTVWLSLQGGGHLCGKRLLLILPSSALKHAPCSFFTLGEHSGGLFPGEGESRYSSEQ